MRLNQQVLSLLFTLSSLLVVVGMALSLNQQPSQAAPLAQGSPTPTNTADAIFYLTPRPPTPVPTPFDRTPPQTTFEFSGQRGNNDWYQEPVTIVFEGVDDEVGIGSIYYRFDQTEPFTEVEGILEGHLTAHYTTTLAAEGQHDVQCYAQDLFANIPQPEPPVPLKIDLSPPTATVKLNPSGRYSRCELLRYVVGDAVSGLDSVVVAVDGRRVSHNTRGLPGDETPTATTTATADMGGATETPTPTATAIPPTETPVLTVTMTTLPPTETVVPTATAIPPTETAVPTVTALPPTETPVPTATDTPSPTATATSLPPTASASATVTVATSLPTATPSCTLTALPPSATATETGTSTPLPTATPSATPLPTDTATVTPSATMTVLPTLLPPTVTPSPWPTLAPHNDSRTLSLLELEPGAHTIALTVTDKAGWVTTVVQPIEVVVDIPSLICTTQLWQQVGGIYGPQATQLTNDLVGTLQQAQAALTTAEGYSLTEAEAVKPPLSRQTEAAIGFMAGYIQQVTAETDRAIRPNAAAMLTRDAQAIIKRLRQGNPVTGQSERQGIYLPMIEK